MARALATEWLSGADEPGKHLRAWAPGRTPGAPASRPGPPEFLAPWLRPEKFGYAPLGRGRAAVGLIAALTDAGHGDITDPWLVVRRRLERTIYPAATSVVEARSDSGLLWLVSFELPLEVVAARWVAFTLTASGRLPVALPSPLLDPGAARMFDDLYNDAFLARRARRYVLAVGAGVAVATYGSAATASVAAADGTSTAITTTATNHATTKTPGTKETAASTNAAASTTGTSKSTTSTRVHAHAPTSRHRTASLGPAIKITRSKSSGLCEVLRLDPKSSDAAKRTSHTGPQPCLPPCDRAKRAWHPGARKCAPAKHQATKKAAKKHHRAQRVAHQPGGGASHTLGHHPTGGVGFTRAPHHPGGSAKHTIVHQPSGSARHTAIHHPSGGAGLVRSHVLKPHLVVSSESGLDTDDATPPATAVSPGPVTIWDGGFNVNPFSAQQLEKFSRLVSNLDQPPRYLVPIYKAAGKRYHVPWQILAAINAVETDYGRDLAVSPAGAIGWMQFMPATWTEFGIAADGNLLPNPYDPSDAIFSAARYLAVNGAPRHMRRALYAYNPAWWYVDAVLWRAELISDYALGKAARGHGYALPLDAAYMRQLGRTDDGVDIEDAPDGSAVYSITPGIVTDVASDPTGFGPDYPVIMATRGPLAGQYIYYGHVAASLVHVGQHVVAGQPIAVMGHTGDAASLGHGHIEIGFSDSSGDPLNHHGLVAWTPSGDAMRHVIHALWTSYEASLRSRPRRTRVSLASPVLRDVAFVLSAFHRMSWPL